MDKKIKKSILVILCAGILVSCISVSASSATKKIRFGSRKKTIYVGKKLTLKAIVPKKYKKKTSKIKWSSSNKKVAVVNKKGRVTAKKAGKAYIKAVFMGTTAKCRIIVKKKNKPQATASQKLTASPKPTTVPVVTDTPQQTNTPIPSEIPSALPTADTNSPSPTPVATSSPTVTETPQASPTVVPTPTLTPNENDYGKLTKVSKGAVVAYGIDKIKGEVMTVYLMDRAYDGQLNLDFAGKEYSVNGKVKDTLVALDTTYVTKTNSAKTITVSRKSPEVYWTVTDLTTNNKYYFKVERRNTYDTSYKNCGAIYFKGDVRSAVKIQ